MDSVSVPLLATLTGCLSYLGVNWIRLNLKRQLIDLPNARSSHVHPTPRGGGLGFIVASALGLCIYSLIPGLPPLAIGLRIWLLFVPLIVIGLIDDWKNLPAAIRYVTQLLVSTGIALQVGPFPQPWFQSFGETGNLLALATTVIAMTAAINFYNFMDGLDGLVAGCAALQLGFCSIYLDQPALWLIFASLLGFLKWNWSPAKIFMGDAGSTTLGLLIPVLLLVNANASEPGSVTQAWASLVVIFPLILDAVYTLLRRAIAKENIFKAHRSHLYQRLHQNGLSHVQVSSLYLVATLLSILSVLLQGWSAPLISCLSVTIGLIMAELYIHQMARKDANQSSEFSKAIRISAESES
jgi:Fuc2NAc and GlcNAc transferase